MSLMKTLAKVAIGVAVAKGASSMMQKSSQQSRGSTGDGGLFGGPHSPQQDAMAGSPLEGIMDSVLGGGQQNGSGGIGGILESLGQTQSAGSGGLGDILGGLAKQSGGAGGLGDLLGSLSQQGAAAGGLGGLLGGLAGAASGGGGGSFGQVLNSQFESNPEPAIEPDADQEAAAALMLSAMLQAAKSDGKFDADEQAKLIEKLGEVSAQERAFVEQELKKPVDVDGLVKSIPRGLFMT